MKAVVTVLNVAKKQKQLQEQGNSTSWENVRHIQQSHFFFYNEDMPWGTAPRTHSFESIVSYGCFSRITTNF